MKTLSTVGLVFLIAGISRALSDITTAEKQIISPSDSEPIKLLYGESHGISWTDLSIEERRPPLLTRKYMDVFSVDYHYSKSLIFYTGWGAVWRLPMEEAGGEAQGKEVVGEDAGAASMVVDWERDRIYWTSPALRTVWRADLEGQNRDLVITNTGNLTRHNNMVVDPYMRYLFVATNSGYSLRTDLNGDDLVRLNHGLRLTSLALDIHTQRLYVSGNRDFFPVLLSCDYDGRNVINYKLYDGSNLWVRLVSIDVFSASQPLQMFWVHHDWQDRDTAWRVNVTDGQLSWQKEYTSRGTSLDPVTKIWCVKVCHPDVQSRPKYLEKLWLKSPSSSKVGRDFNGRGPTTDANSGALSSLRTQCFGPLLYLLLFNQALHKLSSF